MLTLAVAILSFVGFIIAYNTYGRWLSRRIFAVDGDAPVPSRELCDDVDFVPTRRQILFGHHFTSIAGTGPIVGPAIAVFWGWLPALLWVVFGSIFVGAVHDFATLLISVRSRGQTIGEVAGRLINPRARILFLLILFFALTVVLAVFGLVIAVIFSRYPQSVLSVWIAMPVAVAIGFYVRKRRSASLLGPSLIALAILYGSVWIGVYYTTPTTFQALETAHTESVSLSPDTDPESLIGRESAESIVLTTADGVSLTVNAGELLTKETADAVAASGQTVFRSTTRSAVVSWTMLLMIYCFFASVLPVWVLLQPRDYINSHQLVVALILLIIGLGVAGLTGKADLAASTPAVVPRDSLPADAPPLMPFLFITIACGACSGFHCLVSSGTSSKQISSELDAQFVGYGSMLMEGALAVLVILACCAGVGMGRFELQNNVYVPTVNADGVPVTGAEAWRLRYGVGESWAGFGLPKTVGAFVEGGANFVSSLGIPLELSIGIIAVLVACFAATTLDTATRLQRYVVQELAGTLKIRPLTNKYAATALAVGLGLFLAMLPGRPGGPPGQGGLILWPLFGATNQLLAGLAFLVVLFYLVRRRRNPYIAAVPAVLMSVVPAAALAWNVFHDGGWLDRSNYLLVGFAAVILTLQIWMVIECLILLPKVVGIVEEALPPLPGQETAAASGTTAPPC